MRICFVMIKARPVGGQQGRQHSQFFLRVKEKTSYRVFVHDFDSIEIHRVIRT